MILMWLGSFVLMMFGLSSSQNYVADFFVTLQGKFLNKGLDSDFKKMLIRSLDIVVLEASPQKSLYSGISFYNLRVLGLRSSVLVMCLSTLGAWWILLLGFLFMSFNSLFLLGLCSLGLLSSLITKKIEKVLGWIFSTGIFLLGGEIMLRNSSILQSTLGESDLVFFLSDGRFPAVFSLLGVAIAISFVVQIEFWSLPLALGLLFTNVLSLNGALGLLAGERIGRMLLFWWHTRNLSEDCRQLGRQFAVVSALGAILGLFIAGAVRESLSFGYSSGLASFQDKSLQFLILFMIILATQFIAQMVWGHFAAQREQAPQQQPQYISDVWFRRDYFSSGCMKWIKGKIHNRLSEIRYHVQGLGTLKEGQVPEHIQVRLKTEEMALQKIEGLI